MEKNLVLQPKNIKLPTACIYLDQNNIFFRYKKLDFKKLIEKLKDQYNIISATSYMALDHNQDAQKKFVTYIVNNGWKCQTVDVSINTNIDGMIVYDMTNDYQNKKPDSVILISGDGDYAYPLDQLSKKGANIFVIGAKDFTSIELLKVADRKMYLEEFSNVILEVNKES